MSRIFLLSPADLRGERARILLREQAAFDLAVRLRARGASIGEVFAFMSGLYFRGKLAYAQRFAAPPAGIPGILVITAGHGLMPADKVIKHSWLCRLRRVPVDLSDERYRLPLLRDLRSLRRRAGSDCEAILLGSVATGKYLEPLAEVLGPRLAFPADFVGRGDLSRGGLLLRCAREGRELDYVPLEGPLGRTVRRGPRPPRLDPVR